MIWLLLLLSLAALAVSLLTVVRVPTAIDWKIAVLAGELGYALALLPVSIALIAWWGRSQAPGMTWLVLATCTLALVCLLKPVWQAWRLDCGLPARLTAAFGPVPVKSPAFAVRNLVRSAPPAGPVQTHKFAAGLALDFYPSRRSMAARPRVWW